MPDPSSARSAQRAHYLDLIAFYTELDGESEIDLILMHLPRTKESVAQDDRNASTPTDEGVKERC